MPIEIARPAALSTPRPLGPTATRRGERLCPCCQTWVHAERPSVLWRIPLAVAFLGLIAVGVLISVMPPLNIVGIPIFFLVGSSLMGFLGEKVSAPAICPDCGKAMDLP
jgi:hypothetical protein